MGHPVVSASSAAPGAPGRRALGVLALLLLLLLPRRSVFAWHAGETCQRWHEGHPVPVETFLCPQESDGADAWFCCGTCARSYCCSSHEAWLDQRPCFQPGLARQAEVVPTLDSAPAAAPQIVAEYLMLGFVVALTLLLFLACFLLVNYELLQHYLGHCVEQQDASPVPAAALHPIPSVEEPPRPGPLDLPVPYSSCEMLLPPSSEEDPQRD